MDAKSFGDFLVSKLNELGETLKNNLLTSAYKEIDQSHRASGTLGMINEITSKMDNLLNDFYAQQNGEAPKSTPQDGE